MYPNGTPMQRLREEMNRVFYNILPEYSAGFYTADSEGSFPSLNIWTDNDAVHVEAELPGLKLEDLDVTVKGVELTIKGERKSHPQQNLTYHRRERGVGAFHRLIKLPVAVDVDKVEARMSDGVLSITLPKSAAAKTKKIEIRAQ